MKVFVYGTLRTGDCRFGVDGFLSTLAEEAYITGFDMLNLGSFPGLVPGEGKIRGEVQEHEDLEVLDRIEGYNDDSPGSGLYTRQLVTAATDDGEIEECWVYIFNRSPGGWGSGVEIVESGDWFEERGIYDRLAETTA